MKPKSIHRDEEMSETSIHYDAEQYHHLCSTLWRLIGVPTDDERGEHIAVIIQRRMDALKSERDSLKAKVNGNPVTMWAELVADEDGERWWRCNEEGSRTEAIDYDILNLTAAGFPIGSRLTISESQE